MKPSVNAEPEQITAGSMLSVSWSNAPSGARLFAVDFCGEEGTLYDFPLSKPSGSMDWFAPQCVGKLVVSMLNADNRRIASDTVTVI